jgi:DNA-binding Lrp family transcriptional regulator
MDDLDRAVVGCLLEDARATYAEIGDQVGLSAPAVKRRVDRLVELGVIKGFTAVIDPAAMGWATEAYIELTCAGNVAPETLRSMLQPIPEVVGACSIAGSADALVHMLAGDIAGLERALERLRAHPNVDHSKSAIVLSRLIDRPRS